LRDITIPILQTPPLPPSDYYHRPIPSRQGHTLSILFLVFEKYLSIWNVGLSTLSEVTHSLTTLAVRAGRAHDLWLMWSARHGRFWWIVGWIL
jgi:hypothetical protein